MKDDLRVILIAEDRELCEKLQTLLYSVGYKWPKRDVENKKFWHGDGSQYDKIKGGFAIRIDQAQEEFKLSYSDYNYYRDTNSYKNYQFFSVKDQWDEIEMIFGVKTENPNIYFKGQGYTI